MKPGRLENMTVEALVEYFAELGVEQHRAELLGDDSAFNRLYDKVDRVRNELKSRDGDQRAALLQLYNHPNMQVRLNAATSTLAVAPEVARKALEAIAASHHYPQAGDAGMTLFALDDGIFKPT
jgi:hypothetical protein